MSRAEIRNKFDEIVAFAEVDKYLDTPVKRYSSGMYVRLAFAVAAHLEPEILVVDEVLAVGDADFQRKCLGKMQDVSRGGRTILFVSHNMGAVSTLCDRGMVFTSGRVAYDGPIQEAMARYSSARAPYAVDPGSPDMPRVVSVALDDKAAAKGEIRIRIGFESPWELAPPLLGVVVTSNSGTPVFGVNTAMDPEFSVSPVKRGTIELVIKDAPLHSGLYKASIWFGEKNRNYARLDDAIVFDFVAPVPVPAGVSLEYTGSVRVNGRFALYA
jgi:lipopolysaccharide transport system ATP-binding protein